MRKFVSVCVTRHRTFALHSDCPRSNEKKEEKYFKGKVAIFTVQSFILDQYPVDLLTYLELLLKTF